MSLKGHYQNAYVTHDLQRCMDRIGALYGVSDFLTFEPEMAVQTPDGERTQRTRVATAWAGALQIELIEPVSGYIEPFLGYLPADKSDAAPRFHHISLRRESEAAIAAEVAAVGLPPVCRGGISDIGFTYVDARETLGHFLEYVWASPAGWEMLGWPKGRAVE